jgi:hypothetical protein
MLLSAMLVAPLGGWTKTAGRAVAVVLDGPGAAVPLGAPFTREGLLEHPATATTAAVTPSAASRSQRDKPRESRIAATNRQDTKLSTLLHVTRAFVDRRNPLPDVTDH